MVSSDRVTYVVALRGAATLRARALKEVWNVAAVIPVDKGFVGGSGSNGSNGSSSGELAPEENFLGICSRELLARGGELLKRTRKGIKSHSYSVIVPRELSQQGFGVLVDT